MDRAAQKEDQIKQGKKVTLHANPANINCDLKGTSLCYILYCIHMLA